MIAENIFPVSNKNIEIGKRLRSIRTVRGYTQQQLAGMVQITDTMISRYENTGLNDALMIDKLSQVLKADLWYSATDVEREPGIIDKEIIWLPFEIMIYFMP